MTRRDQLFKWAVYALGLLPIWVLDAFVLSRYPLFGVTPILLPVAVALGVNPVHFGIVMIVNIMIGGITPPFGSMMFTCVSITGCKMQEFIKECVPFIIALLIALLLLTYIPGISMLIPNLIY